MARIQMAKSELALELARLSEEATPAVLSAVLAKFLACGNCGLEKDSHPQKDCHQWVAGFGMKDGLELLDRLTEFSLHEAKVEDALGLKKKEMAEKVPWLIGIDVGAFKRMTQDERERKVLEAMGSVIDVPALPGPPA